MNRFTSAIVHQNNILRRELGSTPTYSWQWSEDLVRVMDVVNQDASPVYEAVNRGDVYAVQQAKKSRKLAPDLVNQWCICALIDPYTVDGKLDGSGRAIWMPVRTKTRSKACAMPENQEPTLADTESFVYQMKKTRARDEEEMQKWEDQNDLHAVPMDESDPHSPMISRARKKKFDEDALKIRDKFTAFGEEPGKRGSTSFPATVN